MKNSERTRFVRWARKNSSWRGLICHFYIAESTKQYYSKTDFALLNLMADSRGWIVKGTPEHGIRSKKGFVSPVPCLNCFEVNDKFYKALKELGEDGKFDFGLILNKRKIANIFDRVIDVEAKLPKPLPPPKKCHYYDSPHKRYGALSPFHYCDVVRIEMAKLGPMQSPVTSIPQRAILAYLVRSRDRESIGARLRTKRVDDSIVFSVL